VVERDATADGSFVYAVTTTGVYCRPSCPSRPAKPEHIMFYDAPFAAEQAGFRPCKRCQPNQPPRAEQQARIVTALCRYIEAAEHRPTLEELARRAGWSTYHLHRVFKAVTGLTPRAYGAAQQARRIRGELTQGDSVTQAIYDAGYNSSGRFYAESDQLLGMTPSDYRAGGAGMQIRFAVGESSLGSILVAQSQRGVCAIFLGDDPEVLVQQLQDQFPTARLLAGERAFEQLVARVVGFVESPALGLELPLDIRGTAFQRRVWEVLRLIPPGTTLSYRQVAERIGSPRAARAVAKACAGNALAVAIPCHRVVRNDGALSGYRWGIERKRTLLEREADA
jgi:AraC family transcriptional regulator of adaptative response/methylated-DNA-[protein]-cysteine methyltransferase